MIKFMLKRLGVIIPTLLGVSILAFGLIRFVPGDPVLLLLGERGASPELYAKMQANLGLDKPVLTQYGLFIKNMLQGDFGTSVVSKQPVLTEFMDRFPATLELGFTALLFAILLGIPCGIFAAINRNKFPDYSVMGLALVGYSMPIFWWGLVLILIFSVTLGITPVSGRLSVMFDIDHVTGFMLIDTLLAEEDKWPAFLDAIKHLILPAIAMGTIPLAVIARMTRSSMLEVIGEDYMRTAKAKGLPKFQVIAIHGLRNALIPVVTIIGLMFGSIITGAILTETIFSWPGIGKWMVASVTARDYPVIQGAIIFIAAMIIFINMMIDITYVVVNPKMRN
ncbi:MAG: dipeptide transport system permease protein [Thermoproteota archaeon]|jgi:dipeptide transport system permease protein